MEYYKAVKTSSYLRQNGLVIILTITTFQIVNGFNYIHNLTQLTIVVESRMVLMDTWASVI